ncbi:hypothetical protein INT44_001784 [Umbelopsis vinacea]|uniref:Chloride channel protein n=1 Tax=Umbelopsis vinacea TaxID=44442 RepID=A0A8H7PR87_9FUNG|nr:hypothetical protein INT44_001784 [Umbelopsis vinacea]
MPDETTPILHHVRRRTTGNTDYDSLNDSGRPSRQDSRVLQSRRSSFHFMKRRTGAYDEDSQGLINENTGIRVWYENYSSIGKLDPRSHQGKVAASKVKITAWLTIIGLVVAIMAWLIDIIQELLTDWKDGFCVETWRYNHKFCCWGKEEYEPCPAWQSWPEILDAQSHERRYYTAMGMYLLFGLVFCGAAALLVKYSAERVTTRVPAVAPTHRSFSRTSSTVLPPHENFDHENTAGKSPASPLIINKTKMAYYCAGSGIPEVKVILGGFVIKGFLGIKTLFVKSVGLILSTSSGLNCGKEGPFVHIGCCVGNIACRLFNKFNKNEGKRREILSASAAAGVSVAFGAPIGGVLFSLEEVSYYFPIKTMIRSYFCALVAAMFLKILNPFGTGKIVMFQVRYDKEYHVFELFGFVLCGIFGGLMGALFSYCNIRYQRLRKTTIIGKYPVLEALGIMSLTVLVSFWSPYARMSLTEFVTNLFSECLPKDDNEGLCAKTASEIPPLVFLLLSTLVIKLFLSIVTFGIRVPGGVFLPSLAIGAIFGRAIGLVMQYLTLEYHDNWIFAACPADFETHGRCVIPGVYAMVGAAASLAGVTRTTVSLVVIMFELTHSLTYAVPIMAAVMIAKWVADAFFPSGIYDLVIDLQEYPYLESKREYIHKTGVSELTEYLETIDVEKPTTVNDLRKATERLEALGYAEDGGFPIVTEEYTLVGYIACSELLHAIDVVTKRTPDGGEGNIKCNFKRTTSDEFSSTPMTLSTSGSAIFTENGTELQKLGDFSQYVDQAPLTVNQHASVELVMELFIKLGVRYVCVTNPSGKYQGIIHKRRLLAYLKELEEEEGNEDD